MKVLKFICTLFINLVILKSINGQTKNFVIGYCDSTNAALIYRETVTIINNKENETGWVKRLWNWVTFSSSESSVLTTKRTYPPPSSNYNNCNITCVRFADLIQNGTGGVGKISSGGIGKNFVELELTSQPDKGMFYSIALYGFCRSPIDQSITSGAVPNQDIGWKWNLANNTNTSNQNGIGSQSADNNYTQTGQVNYGWKSPEYNVTNNTDPNLRPGWIIPRNTSVSVIPDNGWNKPINSSYSPFSSDYNNRNNNGNNYRFAPIPPPLILPAGGPPLPNPDVSSNGGPPPNAPYGWNNNLYNSSERQSRYIPWRN